MTWILSKALRTVLAMVIVSWSLPALSAGIQYAIVVDAGSSGSRAHIFEYVQSLPMIPLPVIKDIFSQSSTPGLSSFASNPENAGASLKTILDATATTLQNSGVNLSDVTIMVYATAGMRLLSPTQQAAIYANVRSYIRSHYAFSLTDANVQTISGVMEGVYDWLDVNYLLNNFLTPPNTVGSIDMGGASTQIAFVTDNDSLPDNIVPITINHTRYTLFSQSFLGLGQDQALNTMTADSGAASCYPQGYAYGSGSGNFNFSGCDSIYASIILSHQVTTHILPTTGQTFIAFSGIYYNYNFFNILQTPSQSALLAQINAICLQTWAQLQAQYSDPHLSSYCANGVYFNELLYTSYQLQGSQLRVLREVNGTGIDWTLGALLYSLL